MTNSGQQTPSAEIFMKLFLALLLPFAIGGCVIVPVAGSGTAAGDRIMLCHKGKKTLDLPSSAVQAHLDHGDRYGSC